MNTLEFLVFVFPVLVFVIGTIALSVEEAERREEYRREHGEEMPDAW